MILQDEPEREVSVLLETGQMGRALDRLFGGAAIPDEILCSFSDNSKTERKEGLWHNRFSYEAVNISKKVACLQCKIVHGLQKNGEKLREETERVSKDRDALKKVVAAYQHRVFELENKVSQLQYELGGFDPDPDMWDVKNLRILAERQANEIATLRVRIHKERKAGEDLANRLALCKEKLEKYDQ